MNFLTQEEKDEQLFTFNEVMADFDINHSVIELFREQVDQNANKIAIKGEQLTWTYKALDEITSQLAHCLRQNHDIGTSDLIGVKLDNNEWAIVSLLGILKSGAAYVPIDPDYPTARKQSILSESGLKLLITDTGHLFDEEEFDGSVFAIDVEFDQNDFSKEPPEEIENLDSLAYVIYTSGSTGKPKGVMISHRALANYLISAKNCYTQHTEVLDFGCFSSLSFDLTITSIYLPLITGGCVHLFDHEPDISAVLSAYLSSQINCIKLTPAHVTLIGGMDLSTAPLEVAIVGGDVLTAKHIKILKSLNPEIHIYNEYGPTEATVGCMVKEIETEKEANLIGHPINNTQVFLLSGKNDLQPLGVVGEICISGAGLALGYLNQPDQTAEKFIDHPFLEGERLYKTGDFGKWQSDGCMAFSGRKDDQVKVKGYRIELGEIEQTLIVHEKVDQAVVLTGNIGEVENKVLVCYFTASELLHQDELISALKTRLPEYMIPVHFMQLDELPLTPNGKVDKLNLPDLDPTVELEGKKYVEPSGENEKALASVWKDVLKREKIGAKDNFYILGGDSIKSIQVVARLKQLGLTLKVEHILKYPVLEDLSNFIEASHQTPDQSEVTGPVELTPIQKWFFESPQIKVLDHFNQSVLLRSAVEIEQAMLEKVIAELTKHHDGLRMVYKKTENGWRQINQEVTATTFKLEYHDLTKVEKPEQQILRVTEKLQMNIVITKDQLFKVAHFRLKDGDRIALIIHHLVVDGVSWRILLEDLDSLYNAFRKGEQPVLPEKTSAFKYWAAQQKEYAQCDQLLSEKEYWDRIIQEEVEQFPFDKVGKNLSTNDAEISIQLSEKETELLKTKVHQQYTTDVNDLLLTGLALAIADTFNCQKTRIELEGHGRESSIRDVDITRTVGWFTTIYPFVLKVSNTKKNTDNLVAIKDELRRIPQKGIGYGILKYLSKEGLKGEANAQVRFNYLGDFGNKTEEENTLFSFANEPIAVDSAIENRSDVPLDINSIVMKGSLNISIRYSSNRFLETTLQKFAQAYKSHLVNLIHILAESKDRILTPSDLTFDRLSVEDVRELNADQMLEDGYELSPLQKGIYYHWLTNTSTSLYLEQTAYRIKVKNLPINKLKRAYDALVQRYAVLRTSFTNNYGGKLLQVVRKQVASNFRHTIIKNTDGVEQVIARAKQDDLNEGFDLNQGSQMRLNVLEIGNGSYEFIWSHHHILMDGWCISVLVNDFNKLLSMELKGEQLSFSPVTPYANYIKWLNDRNPEKGLKYWNNYLADYDVVAEIPFKQTNSEGVFSGAELALDVTDDLYKQLDDLCVGLAITHNSFVQAVWGYLLSRYNNTRDVVFGAVVSGRPAELSGVEEMIGLFSNTIPVRVNFNPTQSVQDILLQIHSESIESASHHFLSLAEIQSQAENGIQLINHVLMFQNYALKALEEGKLNSGNDNGFTIASISSNVESNYDFNIVVSPQTNALKISFKYNSNCFTKKDVDIILNHFRTLIKAFVLHPQKPLNSINYLTDAERELILEKFGHSQCTSQFNEKIDHQTEATILATFKKMVQKVPDKIALISNEKQITYQDLDALSDQLAVDLKQRYAILDEDLVGIQLNRNEWMIVAILGVMKAGGAYV